ncbi:Sfi1 spindle body protein-domain-containing protein [Pseudomassariella vexata]|uniref:Sfi1 spindle body protein-domain-containing protein n=1 Tax=Pseudomassariella vexata TaxID=1141098 RepID=A0A1Y2DXL5_9PEZI|nr:Sfi1 spindle body protein-domain-containing protein [Pseudomassariella vexata]ORY63977.1 Sfi1 spindle body protein-domain-containing protein [Pseudomassariella vexata]
MASGSDSEPSSPLSSIATSVLTDDHSPPELPPPRHVANSSSHAGGDGNDEYDSFDLQILFDIVTQADIILPNLPANSRLPTNALFQAYNEVLPDRGIDPEHDQHLSKLVFKIGGMRTGITLKDKFDALLAKMNITVEYDKAHNSSDPSTNYSDDYTDYEDDDQSTGTVGLPPLEQITRSGDDKLPNGYGSPPLRRSVTFNDEPQYEPGPEQDSEPNVDRLENSVIAFERHRSRFSTLECFRRWQTRSAGIRDISEQIAAAWDAEVDALVWPALQNWWDSANVDLKNMDETSHRAHDILSADRIRAKVGDWWFAANFDSKRMNRIACRTYEIKITKNALVRWRKAARALPKRPRTPPKPPVQPDSPVRGFDESDHDPRLARLAARAHHNLMKSRLFAQWSNRAAEEASKADLAVKAHEMGLKSRAFGVRPKLEVLVEALRQRRYEQAPGSPSSPELLKESFEMVDELEADEPPPETSTAPPAEREELPSRAPAPNPPPVEAKELRSRPTMPSFPPKQLALASTASIPDSPYDERTMLARRHIVRLRFFTAWLDYTAAYSTSVKAFAMEKVIDTWRGRLTHLGDLSVDFFAQNYNRHLARTFHMWLGRLAQSQELQTKAEQEEFRVRVIGALKPWLAAARNKRRLRQRKGLAFEHWFNQADRDVILEEQAEGFYVETRLSTKFFQWRTAAEDARLKQQELQRFSHAGNYYRSTFNPFRAWLAKAREASGNNAAQVEAFELWQERYHDQLPLQQLMESYAVRCFFYNSVTKVLPMWREAAREAAGRQQQLEEYGARADYYYKTRDLVLAWRTQAKKKRKKKLNETYREVRQRVRKELGARYLVKWRKKLQLSLDRYEMMNAKLEEITAEREWEFTAQAFDAWRERAQKKSQFNKRNNTMRKQRALDGWREYHAEHLELQTEARDRWQDGAASKALKGWNLSSLQRESRRHTVANVLEKKDRKALRQGFEGWYGHTADKLVPTQLPDGSYQSVDSMIQDAKQRGAETRATGVLIRWRSAVNGGPSRSQSRRREQEEERDKLPYAPTPGARPQLLLGSLGRRQTTTPLAPIPNRQQPWQRDSVLGGSTISARGNRSGRPRRNLRVSWAQ